MRIEDARFGQEIVVEFRGTIRSIGDRSGKCNLDVEIEGHNNRVLFVPIEFARELEEPKEVLNG